MKDNTLLIMHNEIKEEMILKITNEYPLLDIKYISLEELYKKFFNYDVKAIYYLMDKYKFKYEVALTYLDNMFYIQDDFDDEKLKLLLKLKDEVKDYIISSRIDIYKNRNIVVYGYELSKFDLELLKKLSNNIEVIKDEPKYKHSKIYQFKTLEKEVEFVFDKIVDLLKNNININNIKLIVSNDYYNTLKRMSSFYNIPIEIPSDNKLSDTLVGSYFIKNYNPNIINEIKDKFNDVELINKLIDIVNKYVEFDFNEVKDLIIYEVKNCKIKDIELKNSIRLISFDSLVSDDDYVFILGFNYGVIPNIYKDEDLLSDKIKEKIGLLTSKEKNIYEKNKIINKINNIKNLTISYKLKNNNEEYTISNLNDVLNLEVVDNDIDSFKSDIYNKIKLTSSLDKLVKYNIKENNLSKLFSNYQDIKYMKYDNKYTKIDKNDFNKFINNKILLSYSSLDNYFKCGFKYYLNNILRISPYKETYYTVLGNLFHYVLSNAFLDNFDLDKCYDEFLNKQTYEFNNMEKFFIKKAKDELIFIIDTIKKQYKDTNLNNAFYEKKVFVDKSTDVKVTFMGVVDKLLYKEENDKTIVCIVDYKTGNTDINIDYAKYGLSLQLPIYLYLSKNMDLKNVEVAGFYLQKILNNEIKKDNKHTYLELKEDNLKLVGYTNDNLDILEKLDKNYENSNFIKSLKTTSKGFSSYSKMINNEEINNLINLVDSKITIARDEILDTNFMINPKKIDNKNIGCEYCEFRDVCFRKENDIVILESGDENAKMD